MSQAGASELRREHRTQPDRSQPEIVRAPEGRQSSASLCRPRSGKAGQKQRAATSINNNNNDHGDHGHLHRRPRRPDWTRARALETSGSDNSKQAIVGGHLGQLSCPASDACEPMRAPALYRPRQGQAPDFVGRLPAEAAREQRQLNYPCCILVGSPAKSAEQASAGQRTPQGQRRPQQQQQVAEAAPMAVAPPIGGAGQASCAERLSMANHGCPALDCDEADDSECSCSNSLDCLASQPMQPPALHHHQPVPAHLQQQQQQPSPGLDPQQPLLLSAHHQHLPLRSHQHRRPQSVGHHQHQQLQLHGHHQQHRLEQEECSFIESQQQQQNNRQRQQHQAQTFHRPLMANSSVSALPASPGAQMSGSPPRQVPPAAPQPPPSAAHQPAGAAPLLARQATYTAAADTITDSSLMGAPTALTPPQQQQAAGASDFSNPANEWRQQQVVGQYCARTGAEAIELQPAQQQKAALKLHVTTSNTLGRQRQAVSFRRSATSVASGQQQQQHRQRAQTMSRNSHLDQQQAPPTMPGQVMMVSGGESTSTRVLAGASNPVTATTTNTTTTGQQLSNGADRQPVGLQHVCPSSPVVGGAANPAHLHRQQHLAGVAYSPDSPLTIAEATAAATARGLPLRGSHLLASQQLSRTLSLPPISSHRTNSPWMRISSIILAPLGLVIVLFIVVSPLLHSKTKF